jgi:hypothetical protein
MSLSSHYHFDLCMFETPPPPTTTPNKLLNLPGVRGASARFVWSSGEVTMSNAVVQATAPDAFFDAWHGVTFH